MEILYNAFYIILFTTMMGSVFTLLCLLMNRVFRIALPLWSGILGMALYVVPVLSPGLFLVSPEEQVWLKGYETASMVWACGIMAFVPYSLLRILFARRAISGCQACDEESIGVICARCAAMAGLKRIPEIYFGVLDDPACVVGTLRPKILLNREVAVGLTDTQLTAVLGHEIMHIKRGHMVLGKIFACICVLNWPNPFVWMAKKEFDVLCEIDCDKHTLKALRVSIDHKVYAQTMLRLLEQAAAGVSVSGSRLSVSGFLAAKRRVALIMNRQSARSGIFSKAILAVAVIMVIYLSAVMSRGHFYPYPAYYRGIEYSQTYMPQ